MANKKINQLVLKTTIQPTDLFPLGDATTGQLFKKTVAELQAAIGGAVISVNGLVGTVVLDTDDIAELATPTNRYFTEARARAAISLTTTGNSGASTYSNSTGVLNVPTYTLAGLGGITASFLSGGTGITYNSSTGVIAYSGTVYTDASIRALFSAGTGITYNSSTGAISYSGTVYTDSSIRGLFSLTTTGTSGAATYNNTTGVINVPNYTLAGLGGISLTALSGTAPITYNSSTGAIGITQASTSTNGFLSSTDWNTFNGKQSALTLGNVSEVVSNVLMFPDGGTNKTIGNLTIQVVQAGSTTNGFLSTTDWNTFNNKQGTITLTTTGTSGAATLSSGTLNIPQYQRAITLTTTGTSGAATFSGGTLNIPQYQTALTNPVTGTGTTNYVTKWTSSSAIGDSSIFDNGNIGIGTVTSSWSLGKALELNNKGNGLWNASAADTRLMTNVYFNGGFFYGSNGVASIMETGDGFIWRTAPIGTANASATFTERMRITSAGNVGIGTSSPTNPLHVSAAGTTLIKIQNTASGLDVGLHLINTSVTAFMGANGTEAFVYTASNHPIKFYTNTVERMQITSTGEFVFNGTSGYALLRTNAEANALVLIAHTSLIDNKPRIEINGSVTSQADSLFIRSANLVFTNSSASTEYMRFTVNGNMLLGTTTNNGERLYVSGSIRATGSITANSDVRLKKNIERIENALQKVSEISGYTYNTIYDEDRHAGVIAQEIDKVLPEIVNKGNDGLMGVEYGNISALLIEAIKEQKVLIESLQAKVEALSK
jgi:hypothetical protein